MKKPKVTQEEQTERDRRWQETLARQNRDRPIPLSVSPDGEKQRQADERYDELLATAKAFWCAQPTESAICEAELRIAFREGKYVLVCSASHVDPLVERIPPLYERWLKGEVAVPIFKR